MKKLVLLVMAGLISVSACSETDNDAVSYYETGNARRAKRQYDQAISDYNMAIEIDPGFDSAYYNRGITWYEMKQYGQAISDFRTVIELSPQDGRACNILAWILATCADERYRDGKRAIQLAKQARKLNPDDPFSMDTLAAAYAEAGMFADAVRTQEGLITFLKEKDDPRAPHLMAGAVERLECYKAGKSWWDK